VTKRSAALFRWLQKGDVVAQRMLIHNLFGKGDLLQIAHQQ
jgi:hypothetical protein